MAEKGMTLTKQVEVLARRLEKLESALCSNAHAEQLADHENTDVDFAKMGFCSLPQVPERVFSDGVSAYREGLIRYISKKWVNGTKLRYYLFDSGPFRGERSNMDLVREGFEAWADVGIGLDFEEVDNIDDAQVRIGFLRGDGSWSYVGRDVVDVPGRMERTMNFGWDLTQDPRGGGLDTPIHEIGHTLGFPHEHQNPFSGIVWDEEAVYQAFAQPPNRWPRETTFHNILRKLNANEVEGSNWDPNSIMHYSFGAGLIVQPAQYRNGLRPVDGLTENDKEQVRKFYPPLDRRTYRQLKSFELEKLNLEPGEQADFVIEPERTDDYTLQTFGNSDVVIVLFEEIDDELEFLDGDDDSGTLLNAKIQVRLVKSRKYVLRIRMYLNWASGESAVMLWPQIRTESENALRRMVGI